MLKSNAISDPKMAATVDQSNQSLDLNRLLVFVLMLVHVGDIDNMLKQEVFSINEACELLEEILEISIPLTRVSFLKFSLVYG